MNRPLREFLEIPYDQLEEMNLSAKQQRLNRTPLEVVREARCKYLAETPGIKSVTVCFSDLEGRLHMLAPDRLLQNASTRTILTKRLAVHSTCNLSYSESTCG
jgi:glutamine synthetase